MIVPRQHELNDVFKEAHRVSGEPCFILKVQLSDQEVLARLLDEILVSYMVIIKSIYQSDSVSKK